MNFKDYDKLSDTYDTRYVSDMSIRENIAVKKILSMFVYPYAKILDVGCGTGFALDMMKNRVKPENYIGIDISRKMLSKAGAKHQGYIFSNFDISKNEFFIKERFDIALSLFSIPYIGIDSIKNIKKTLKNGGVYIVVYYNKPYLNPDSVYHRQRLKYLFTVKPYVDKYIKQLKNEMKLMQEGYLTEDMTYRYAIFKEYK